MLMNQRVAVTNDTFGSVVAQILIAQATREKSKIETLRVKEQSHA